MAGERVQPQAPSTGPAANGADGLGPSAVRTDAAGSPAPLTISRGTCYILFAFDVATSIDVTAAQRSVASADRREILQHRRRAPEYFGYQAPPLMITQASDSIAVSPDGRFSTADRVECVAFDFGAVSVMYSVPIAGPVTGLLELSDLLYENAALKEDARRRVESFLDAIYGAVARRHVSSFVEDYAIYHIDELASPEPDVEAQVLRHAPLVARILRSARSVLSTQETADAMACRIAFAPDDAAFIDWNAAVLVGSDMADVRAVLEYANVELLEMRFLDDRLDGALERSYALLARRGWRRLIPWQDTMDLRVIGELQADGVRLFEGVNNALKLLGDQYLARVYRLAAQRLHLPAWDSSILRKLGALESLYQKMSDYQTTRRLEMLEWIVILLIAFEILLSLFPGLRH
jgi:hypothetical protein